MSIATASENIFFLYFEVIADWVFFTKDKVSVVAKTVYCFFEDDGKKLKKTSNTWFFS